MLLPHANGTIISYWKHSTPGSSAANIYWSLSQCMCISAALGLIHRNGSSRHYGAVTKENILWFAEGEFGDPDSILVFSSLQQTPHEYASYQSPDRHRLGLPSSDIWSLACLYLEFITWLILGSYEDVEDIMNARSHEYTASNNVSNFDTLSAFYTTTKDQGGSEVASIKSEVQDWIAMLHTKPTCTQILHDLLRLVTTKMLLLNSESRITAQEVEREIGDMLQLARKNPPYILEPAPWPSQAFDRKVDQAEGAGFGDRFSGPSPLERYIQEDQALARYSIMAELRNSIN